MPYLITTRSPPDDYLIADALGSHSIEQVEAALGARARDLEDQLAISRRETRALEMTLQQQQQQREAPPREAPPRAQTTRAAQERRTHTASGASQRSKSRGGSAAGTRGPSADADLGRGLTCVGAGSKPPSSATGVPRGRSKPHKAAPAASAVGSGGAPMLSVGFNSDGARRDRPEICARSAPDRRSFRRALIDAPHAPQGLRIVDTWRGRSTHTSRQVSMRAAARRCPAGDRCATSTPATPHSRRAAANHARRIARRDLGESPGRRRRCRPSLALAPTPRRQRPRSAACASRHRCRDGSRLYSRIRATRRRRRGGCMRRLRGRASRAKQREEAARGRHDATAHDNTRDSTARHDTASRVAGGSARARYCSDGPVPRSALIEASDMISLAR